MGSKSSSSVALFLLFNIIFFTAVTATRNCSPPPPKPTPTPTPSSMGTCPRDALKLGVCANVLNLVKGVVVGSPLTKPCCTLIEGLVDLEAAVCLCTAIKANILAINLNIPVSLSLVIDACGKKIPKGFKCA